MIDLQAFQVFGDAALADAFGDRRAFRFEFARRVIAVERGAGGIGEADGDAWIFRAETCGDAGKRAAGTDCADEAIDAALGLFPDFWSCCCDVGVAVGGVIELVGPDGAVFL